MPPQLASVKNHLSENAQRVYEYLLKVQEATKKRIIEDTPLASEEDYGVVKSELIHRGIVKGKRSPSGGLMIKRQVNLDILDVKQNRTMPEGKQKIAIDKLSAKAKKLWDLIPPDGSFVTNRLLRHKLRPRGFSTEDFWKHRKELLDNNLVQIKRGRGGSVARIQDLVEEHRAKPPKGILVKDENTLYNELKKWLVKNRVADVEQSGGQAWVVVTGQSGKWKRRSGHWSRPDVISVEVTTYEYLQQRDVVETTYEIKRYSPQMDNSWVFEAASHSKGAHYAYLVVETPEEPVTDEPPAELLHELRQFGIGFGRLYRKSDTKEYEFNEVLEPDRKSPAPEDQNDLLKLFADKLEAGHLTAFKHAIGKT